MRGFLHASHCTVHTGLVCHSRHTTIKAVTEVLEIRPAAALFISAAILAAFLFLLG